MKKNRILASLIVVIFISFSAALSLKAAVGVGAWDAFAQSGSELTGIKVGTVLMLLNLFCLALQIMLLKGKVTINHLLQVVLNFTLGYAVNFFFYVVLGSVEITSYPVRLVLIITSISLSAFCVASMMLLNVVTFSLEGACLLISERIGQKFHIVRQIVDVLAIAISLLLSFLFQLPLSVREGTVIGMLLFSPLLGFFMERLRPIFQKYDLTD